MLISPKFATAASSTGSALLDFSYRVVYRLGAWGYRRWWAIRRPEAHGAAVAVWVDGRVLVVKQSYRAALGLPGGGLKPGEDPRAAAARELAEEVGVVLAPDALTPAGTMVDRFEGRLDHVEVFDARLEAAPVITVDGREIVWAAFEAPSELLGEARALQPHLRSYLTSLASRDSMGGRPPSAVRIATPPIGGSQ